MDGNFTLSARALRIFGVGTNLAFSFRLAALMGAVSFHRQCGPELLQFRLGIHAAGSGVLHRVSGPPVDEALAHSHFDPALDALSHRVRSRPDQASPRPLLAAVD